MNFIDRQAEDMPPGAAETHEQPMIEKSIADALVVRMVELEAVLRGYEKQSIKGTTMNTNELREEGERLDYENQFSVGKLLVQAADEIERLTTELAAARAEVERLRLGLDAAYELLPPMHALRMWFDNYEAMKGEA